MTVMDLPVRIISRIVSIISLIHSRLLYYPIAYFYMQIAYLMKHSINPKIDQFFHKPVIGAVSIGLMVLSFLLAFFKETFFYRVNKSGNTYAAKKNIKHFLEFIYKTLASIILIWVENSETKAWIISIFAALYSLLAIYTLYSKLPYYNVTLLKYSYGVTSMTLGLSIIGIINTLTSEAEISDTMLVVCTSMAVKAFLVHLNMLFEDILSGNITTPEKAIHYTILLKRYLSGNPNLNLGRKIFQIEVLYLFNSSSRKLNNTTNRWESLTALEAKQELYAKVVDMFANKPQFLKSEVFVLYMARIYMQKLNNASQALALIENLRKMSTSIPIRNSIDSLRSILKEAYFKNCTYSPDDLELANYFAYREEFNSLKTSMQEEIQYHLGFWQELSKDDLNVKGVVDLSNKMDVIYLKIRERWKKSSEKFAQIYPSSLLMYGLYLDSVRGLPQESVPMIQKFYNLNKTQAYKKVGSISDSSAIIIASVEKDKLGVVIDASNTVESLFEVTRERLMGEKVNILMPAFIAKNHDWFMQRYTQSTMTKAIDRKIYSYGKTSNNFLIEVEVNLKVFPYLDKGVNIMSYIKQVKADEHTFIVKPNGTVAEYSSKLQESMEKYGVSFKMINLHETCPEFDQINSAFNLIFTPVEDKQKAQGETEITVANTRTDADELVVTKENQPTYTYNTYTNYETVTDYIAPMKTKTDFTPLIRDTLSPDVAPKKKTVYPDMRTMTVFKAKSTVTEDEAKELCAKYQIGGHIKFENTGPNFGPNKTALVLDIKVEPYVLAGEVYKIVKVTNIQTEDQFGQTEDILGLTTENSDPKLTVGQTFMEEPVKMEFEFSSNAGSFISKRSDTVDSIPDERSEAKRRKERDNSKLKTITTKRMVTVIKVNADTTTQNKDASVGQLDIKEEIQKVNIGQSLNGRASSTKSYSHMDYKLITTLNDFFGEQNIRLVTRLSIYGVYVIMIGIIVLALVNFFCNKSSLTEIDNSVAIVDASSRRLTAGLSAWNWLLMLYTRALGLRTTSSMGTRTKDTIVSESIRMQNISNELRAQINFIGTEEIIKELFAKKILFYDPRTRAVIRTGEMDVFTAANSLAINSAIVGRANVTDAVILTMNEPKMTLNNTGNDFLIYSESQITKIIGGLADVVDNNISLLQIVLIFENLALLALCCALIGVARVVIRSYARTFQALVRLTNESIEDRLYRIKKFQSLLAENIEARSFTKNLNVYMTFFEDALIRKGTKGKDKEKKQRFFSKRYSIRKLVFHVSKYLLASFAFIAAISGLFIYLFSRSVNSFETLEGISSQLAVTNRVSYQSSLVISNFYFFVSFRNDTDYKIRNESPQVQLYKNLEEFGQVNEDLINTLFTEKQENDPIIQPFLQDDICSHLPSTVSASSCYTATQGNALGLLAFNSKMLKTCTHYIDLYWTNTTQQFTADLVKKFFESTSDDGIVLNAAYTFLTNYIMGIFDDEVKGLEDLNLMLSVLMLVFIVLATLMIQRITLKTLIDLDNGQKKIFRGLTYYVFSQNKSVGFLLKKEFGGHIEGLNRILY